MSSRSTATAKSNALRAPKNTRGAKADKALKPLLFNFRAEDTITSVTRDTLKLISETLGLTETQTMHFALAKLRREVLPKYELDDGPVSEATLRTIRRLVPQDDFRPTQSLFKRS